LDFILSAKDTLYCALYEYKLDSVVYAFDWLADHIDVKVLVDKEELKYNRSYLYPDKNHALMHNKICVVDGARVFTGSMNVAPNDVFRNNNNIIFITNSRVAMQFSSYILDLVEGIYSQRYQNYVIDGVVVEAFFCPRDNCALRLVNLIRNSEDSIHFATFSFTDHRIAHELLLAQSRGVSIKGVYEHRMHTLHSTFQLLNFQNVSVQTDRGINTMHHKFFVFDESVVFTGSYNPTLNGNTRNDENVVVLHDPVIAKRYVDEFYSLIN
jgi:phosphatidylserine/phosphatidylglycerophosphate/cardiolipin synthase-like enzyme